MWEHASAFHLRGKGANAAMTMWDETRISEDEHRRLEDRAATDAHETAKCLWRDGIPGGRLEPVAVDATYAFVARLRQESAGLPAWVLKAGQDAMRWYIQKIGDSYYWAFLDALGRAIGHGVPIYRAVPRTTPLPQSSHRRQPPRMLRHHENEDGGVAG